MALLQTLLVYVTLTLAVGYLVKKFLLPKGLLASKKNISKNCGDDNCGCH